MKEQYINLFTDFGFFEKAQIAKFTPEKRQGYDNSLKYYWDLKNVIDTAAMDAEKKGIEKGRYESMVQVATKLLASMDDAAISELTGLNPEQIAQLRNKTS